MEVSVEEAYHGTERSFTISGPDGPRTLDVTIPPGVVDGQRIRLRGQGGQGSGSAAAGDLYLVVRIADHPRYRVEGRDLHALLPVAPWEAALGASVSVDTPGGAATVKVPAGSSSHRRLRLKGRGLPNRRGEPGDFYAELQIRVPGPSPTTSSGSSRSSRRCPASTRGADDDRGHALRLARPYRLSLDSYAQVTGVHPELVRRLVALGLLEVTRDAQGRLWFDPSQVREMARIQRLRMSLNLGYSAIGLVVELLDRIAELEKAQRRMSRRGGAPWT